MILVISTCADELSEEEFVKPIVKIVGDAEVKHYTGEIDFQKYSKIIICGTALRDNGYLNNIDNFLSLKNIDVPVLGICSGMQILCLIFGEKLVKNKEIGMTKIKTIKKNPLFLGEFGAYNLHGNGLESLDKFEVLAESGTSIQAIKHKQKEFYGIMFHPEVRNEKIIKNFLNFTGV